MAMLNIQRLVLIIAVYCGRIVANIVANIVAWCCHDGVMMAEDHGKSSASDEHYLGILPTFRSDEGLISLFLSFF